MKFAPDRGDAVCAESTPPTARDAPIAGFGLKYHCGMRPEPVKIVMYLNIAAAFSFFFLFAKMAAGQESVTRWRVALSEGDLKSAIRELQAVRSSNRKLFEINNYDYLLGRLQERAGNLSAAAPLFQSVVARNSVLRSYALLRLSRISRFSGNLPLERLQLAELIATDPGSIPATVAAARLPRSYFESRDFDSAIRQITAGTGSPGRTISDARLREVLAFVAEAHLRAGRPVEARAAFQQLVDKLPNPAQPDDFALVGALGLDRLDAGTDFGKRAPRLADHIHLQRALIYQFNRDFADARLHYQAIIERFPESGNVPDAMFQIGRGFAQNGQYSEALDWFERLLERFPEHPSAKDALNQSASALARLGEHRRAVERYTKFIDKYPDDERIERAYLNIVDVLRDAGDNAGALDWTGRTQQVFKGKLPEATALFAQLRIRVAGGDWPNALNDARRLLLFGDLGGTRVPGGTTRAEVHFLTGLILEKLDRYSEALSVYLSIPDGRNEYYGSRATERIRALGSGGPAKTAFDLKLSEILKAPYIAGGPTAAARSMNLYRLTADPKHLSDIAEAYRNIDGFREVPKFVPDEPGRNYVLRPGERNALTAADELAFLSLFDEAAPEFDKQFASVQSADRNTAHTLAVLYKRGDFADRAVAFAEPIWRSVPFNYQVELIPREHIELLYPVPYADSLLKFSTPRGVDPRFVLSIMRQESRFRPDVKSAAAARGLMQFISTTSNRIAAELGRSDFRQDDLYDPATSILFGSQYLANIYRDFPDGHAAVAAGYNGGEDNVKRWITRSGSSEPDRYVPEFAFAQSKDYAWKVLANFRVYETFYDAALRPRDPSKPR